MSNGRRIKEERGEGGGALEPLFVDPSDHFFMIKQRVISPLTCLEDVRVGTSSDQP